MRTQRVSVELRGPHRVSDGDSMRFSEFCVALTRQRADGCLTSGIFHRLTGKSYELSESAHGLLAGITSSEFAFDDVEDLPARTFLQRLLSEGFITSQLAPQPLSPCGIPLALADHRLLIPIRNPAIALAHPDGTGALFRNADLDTCHLPRTRWKPEVLRDELSEVAVAILRSAQRHEIWRHAEAELLSSEWPATDIRAAVRFLTDPQRQMLRWISPQSKADHVSAHFQFPCQNFVRDIADDGGVTPAHAHYHGIDDASVNFDWLETTVSHAFRMPTEVFQQESFGARLASHYLPWLRERAAAGRLRILEVGGGMGDLAGAFAGRLAGACTQQGPISYTILDLSPALLHQQSVLKHTEVDFHFVPGDAQQELPPGPFDFILSNEVIADMENVRQPDGSLQQRGALRFITEVARRLAPGGKAYISEYGELDTPPELVEHLDHAEYSIQFRPLLSLARELGLQAVVLDMTALLRPVAEAAVLIGQQERYLCLATALSGGTLQSRVYDQESFMDEFAPALAGRDCLSPLFAPQRAEIHFGPRLSQFKVLELTAPAVGTRSGEGRLVG